MISIKKKPFLPNKTKKKGYFTTNIEPTNVALISKLVRNRNLDIYKSDVGRKSKNCFPLHQIMSMSDLEDTMSDLTKTPKLADKKCAQFYFKN